MAEAMEKGIKILVVDDEENITDFIAYALERELYEVERAYDGIEALEKNESFNPDIIILDIMMPGYDGYEVCKRLKDASVGIIMLTAKIDLVDKIVGLDLGADDYLTKPFEMIELFARVKSLSRRIINANIKTKSKSIINIEGLNINLDGRNVSIDGKTIEFKPKEFELLAFLFKNSQIVFSRDEILSSVWEMDYLGGTRTIDIHIQRIRSKLGVYGDLIKTIPRIGYKVVTSFE